MSWSPRRRRWSNIWRFASSRDSSGIIKSERSFTGRRRYPPNGPPVVGSNRKFAEHDPRRVQTPIRSQFPILAKLGTAHQL
jgi:hypothetical protein